jgi:hypothetical protein
MYAVVSNSDVDATSRCPPRSNPPTRMRASCPGSVSGSEYPFHESVDGTGAVEPFRTSTNCVPTSGLVREAVSRPAATGAVEGSVLVMGGTACRK